MQSAMGLYNIFRLLGYILESRNKDGLSRRLVFYIGVCIDKLKFVQSRCEHAPTLGNLPPYHTSPLSFCFPLFLTETKIERELCYRSYKSSKLPRSTWVGLTLAARR